MLLLLVMLVMLNETHSVVLVQMLKPLAAQMLLEVSLSACPLEQLSGAHHPFPWVSMELYNSMLFPDDSQHCQQGRWRCQRLARGFFICFSVNATPTGRWPAS